MGGLCALRAPGGRREEDVSAESSPARQDARIPRADVDEGRPEGSEAAARQGATPTHGLSGVAGASPALRGRAARGAAPVPGGVRPTVPSRGPRGGPCVRAAVATGARATRRGLRGGASARRQRDPEPSAASSPRGVPPATRPPAARGHPALLHCPAADIDQSLRAVGRRRGQRAGASGAPTPLITVDKVMEKRALIAIALSVAVLLAWHLWVGGPPPPPAVDDAGARRPPGPRLPRRPRKARRRRRPRRRAPPSPRRRSQR